MLKLEPEISVCEQEISDNFPDISTFLALIARKSACTYTCKVDMDIISS